MIRNQKDRSTYTVSEVGVKDSSKSRKGVKSKKRNVHGEDGDWCIERQGEERDTGKKRAYEHTL